MKPDSSKRAHRRPRGDHFNLKWLTVLLFLVSILAAASQAAVAPPL